MMNVNGWECFIGIVAVRARYSAVRPVPGLLAGAKTGQLILGNQGGRGGCGTGLGSIWACTEVRQGNRANW